jgi:hypothetical protein
MIRSGFEAIYFSVAIAAMPLGLALALFNLSELGDLVLALPLCWARHA